MLVLQFTKRSDGRALLRCVRADGSATWQKQEANHANFFPLHDLTHYAVETELGFRRGFYGLIAAGWDIAETTGASPRGPLLEEAIEVEYIVAALSAERTGTSAAFTADEFNQLGDHLRQAKTLPPPRKLTDIQLGRTRSRMNELFVRWQTLSPGETLELAFPPKLREEA